MGFSLKSTGAHKNHELFAVITVTVRHMLNISSHLEMFSLKKLDQGHLHPKLEVPGLTCPGWESKSGLHSGRQALYKEPFEQPVDSY